MASQDDPDRPVLSGENLDSIRARMLARANLGIDPTSPAFLDAIVGAIFGDLEGPAALEIDENYDFAEIVARAVIPTTAFGGWLDEWAESLGLERRDEAFAGGVLTFVGDLGTVISTGQQVVSTATGPDGDPVAFQVTQSGTIDGTGTIDLPAAALTAGSSGNVPAATVTIPTPAIDGLTSVSNANATTGGADIEDDPTLSRRVRSALSGEVGSGTIADYERWGLAGAGVGFVTVRPVARGPGTVDIYLADLNNDPMPPGAIAERQAAIDPVTGEGRGLAPIGHDALVLTHTVFDVDVEAQIVHDAGYTLDGTAGTRATRALIEASIGRYINALAVDDDLVRNKVIGAIVAVVGVANVVAVGAGALEMNGSTAEVLAVTAGSAATVDTITLT